MQRQQLRVQRQQHFVREAHGSAVELWLPLVVHKLLAVTMGPELWMGATRSCYFGPPKGGGRAPISPSGENTGTNLAGALLLK